MPRIRVRPIGADDAKITGHVRWGATALSLPDGVVYGHCKWVDGFLVWAADPVTPPIVYRYVEDNASFSLLGPLPPGGAAITRFLIGYAWIINGRVCSILRLERGLPLAHHVQISADDGTTDIDTSWVIIKATYSTTAEALSRATRDDPAHAEIHVIMYKITGDADRPALRMINQRIAMRGVLVAHDTCGVIYRADVEAEELMLWRPGHEMIVFNPRDMLARPSSCEPATPYVACMRGGSVRCIVVPGLHGVIVISTVAGRASPMSLAAPVSHRFMIIGRDNVCAHVTGDGRFVDASSGADITCVFSGIIGRECGHRLASVTIFGSCGIVSVFCDRGHVYPMQLRADVLVGESARDKI